MDLDLPGVDIRLGATRWPGTGTPIVLLHGLASQRRFWNLVVPHLVGLPLVAIDQRGHGDSDRPPTQYDGDTCAEDLATAMDALGWSRAVVVGHSWGGSVAATFAARHPERTLALVAVDGGFAAPAAKGQHSAAPAAKGQPSAAPAAKGQPSAAPAAKGQHSDRAELRKRLEPPRFALPPEELIAMLRSRPAGGTWTEELAGAVLPLFEVGADGLARARLPFEIHMQIVDTLLDYDAAAVLARVTCPTWLVSCEAVGADDEWSAGKAAALAGLAGVLQQPRLFRWGGAVHDVPLQWPALVAGLVRAAATEVTTAAP